MFGEQFQQSSDERLRIFPGGLHLDPAPDFLCELLSVELTPQLTRSPCFSGEEIDRLTHRLKFVGACRTRFYVPLNRKPVFNRQLIPEIPIQVLFMRPMCFHDPLPLKCSNFFRIFFKPL